MLILNIKLAIRNLLKNKVYSLIIIGGFGIGFAACILIGLYYHREITVNNDFPNHGKIYRIYDIKKNSCNLNWDMYPVLASDYADIIDACPFDYLNTLKLNLRDEQSGNYCEIRNLLATTSNFFSMFSVRIKESKSGEPFDGQDAVSISSSIARSLFGDEDPIGRKISLENYFFGTITSVFDELPENSSFSADIILNSSNDSFRFSKYTLNGKTSNPVNLLVLLNEFANPDSVTLELNKSEKLVRLDAENLALQRLDDIYFSRLTMKSMHARGNSNLLKVFIAIAILILSLSSINYLNYSVSMQYARFRHTGLKKVFGASRKNLISCTITEVGTGILISMVFALFIVDAAISFSDKIFERALIVRFQDWVAMAPYFFAVLIIVILLNSTGSVFLLSKFSISEFLSGIKRKGNGKQVWKQSLLTFQLTVSIALISIVIVIFRQLDSFMDPDPGFNRENLMRIIIPYKYEKTDALRSELNKLPFVLNSAISIGCPGMINMRSNSMVNEKNVDFSIIEVGDNYINTMGLELVDGRDFLTGDMSKTCMINEEALRQFGWEKFEGHTYAGQEVIGIIKDFKFESSYKSIQPLSIQYSGAKSANVLSLRLADGSKALQLSQIRSIWNTISPNQPFTYTFYDDFYKAFYTKEEKLASSIAFFSLIAIVLTCMGILGQIFMICLTRVKEIGIRKINGAKISEILLLLNRDFLIWFTVAFIIATPFALVISGKWLNNFAYKIGLSWWLFALGGLIALLILLITVSWQSWRAASRNPVEALRYE
ncbi:MAG TPA: ABC transporter permease [Bacteroidales bacterium]|nr:ABC transporter permease [Bacteroidales bacterium]